MTITKEQTIEILTALLDTYLDITNPLRYDALKFAITALQSDPNAPDWNQAPDWANWYEIDERGKGFWHEHEPKKTSAGFIPRKGRIQHSGTPLIPQLFKRPDQ